MKRNAEDDGDTETAREREREMEGWKQEMQKKKSQGGKQRWLREERVKEIVK